MLSKREGIGGPLTGQFTGIDGRACGYLPLPMHIWARNFTWGVGMPPRFQKCNKKNLYSGGQKFPHAIAVFFNQIEILAVELRNLV